MYIAFFIYSLSGVFSKIASGYNMISWQYILCFGMVIFILGIYAVMWQQVLKKIQLSVAMANRPVTMIFSTIWAVLFFHETVGWLFFIGLALVIAGLFVIGVQND